MKSLKTIGIVDYGRGNLRSVFKALQFLDFEVLLVREPRQLRDCGKIILPGVGAFGDGMHQLEQLGFREILVERIKASVPFLGICLGLQLLFESSEESPGIGGLSIFKGRVPRFQQILKVPHMGWNQVVFAREHALTQDIPQNSYFYFVHSYFVKPESEALVFGKTNYGDAFTSCVQKDNVCAVQFHPEKSQKLGLQFLKNWGQAC
jgi:glutamine amidotransferase